MAEAGGSTPAAPERYQLFEAGWRHAGCPLTQLWVQYLGLGGDVDLFSLDAFMHGMTPLLPAQQDILANAINDQLDDLYQAAKVPYLHTLEPLTTNRDPLTVLDELFGRTSHDRTDQA